MTRPTTPTSGPNTTDQDWVPAGPFRAYALHLADAAAVPWPVVAYQAGLPVATLRTLIYGRNGKPRTKITRQTANQLLNLTTADLSYLRVNQVEASGAGARIRILRGRNTAWDRIARYLRLDIRTCQAIAKGHKTACSVMVDILAHTACEIIGLNPWEILDAPSYR